MACKKEIHKTQTLNHMLSLRPVNVIFPLSLSGLENCFSSSKVFLLLFCRMRASVHLKWQSSNEELLFHKRAQAQHYVLNCNNRILQT